MRRSKWLPVAGGVVLGLSMVRAAAADDITATLGAKPAEGGDGCVTFLEVDRPPMPGGGKVRYGPIKAGDRLKLIIENRCGVDWQIRIDRDPKRSFSKDCESFAARKFNFEKGNLFAATNDRRGATCSAKSGHETAIYEFYVTEAKPSAKLGKATPPGDAAAKKEWNMTHNLAVEVDP